MEPSFFSEFNCNIEDLKKTLFNSFTKNLDQLSEGFQVSKKPWAAQQLKELFEKFLKDQPISPSKYHDAFIKTDSLQDRFLILQSTVDRLKIAAENLGLSGDYESNEGSCQKDSLYNMSAMFIQLHTEMREEIQSKSKALETFQNTQKEEKLSKIKEQKEMDEQSGVHYKERLSGEMWDCIGRRLFQFDEHSPPCGYLYQFNIKPQYDTFSLHSDLHFKKAEVAKKKSEIHPALEPSTLQVALSYGGAEEILTQIFSDELAEKKGTSLQKMSLDDTINLKLATQNALKYVELAYSSRPDRKYFNELGYRSFTDNEGCLIFELPDLEALLRGWESLQSKYPEKNLPNLDIISCEGISDDLPFVQAYLDHDAVLSNGKEFVHDHHTHVRTRIWRMLKGKKSYLDEKERLCKLFEILYSAMHQAKEDEERVGVNQTVQREWKKLSCMLGIFTDLIFSHEDDENVNWFCNGDFVRDIPTHLTPAYNCYLKKRFGDALDIDIIGSLWEKCVGWEVSRALRGF